MASREQRRQIRHEIADRLRRTPEEDRIAAIVELSEEYHYSPAYIRMITQENGISLPRGAVGKRGPSDSTQAIADAFTLVGMFLQEGATYNSVADAFGCGRQRVVDAVKIAKEKGVIG